MVYIIKNGVVDNTFQKEGKNFIQNNEQKRGFDPNKIRAREIDNSLNFNKKFETPGLVTSNSNLNFKQSKSKTRNELNPNTDLYRIGNLTYSDNKNLLQAKTPSVFIKKDKTLSVMTDINLVNNNYYDTKKSSIYNIGDFEKSLVAPVRKIETDTEGIKFLSSSFGFKNIERPEMLNTQVPIRKNMYALHTPISIVSNGTKTTKPILN